MKRPRNNRLVPAWIVVFVISFCIFRHSNGQDTALVFIITNGDSIEANGYDSIELKWSANLMRDSILNRNYNYLKRCIEQGTIPRLDSCIDKNIFGWRDLHHPSSIRFDVFSMLSTSELEKLLLIDTLGILGRDLGSCTTIKVANSRIPYYYLSSLEIINLILYDRRLTK